jgi:hypothetical protein
LQLSVHVKSAGGEFGALNLSGALVTVSQNGRPVASGFSNAVGVFTTRVPSRGAYHISVVKIGYQSMSKTISVSSNMQTEVVLKHALGATSNFGPRGVMAVPKWPDGTRESRPAQKPRNLPF